jgi:arylsulfatase A-like enzyme
LPGGFGWLLAAVIEPGFVWSQADRTTAQHGSTAPRDVGVPIGFLGAGLRPARVARPVRAVDIAPTLAALLGIAPTETEDGGVLPEVVRSR